MTVLFDHSIEEAVLGALLIDPDAYAYIADVLNPDCFQRDKNRWVFEACQKVFNRNEVIDERTIAHELAKAGRLEPIGGAAYLAHLIAECPTSVHIEYHAGILRTLAARRALLSASKAIEALAELDDVDKAYGDAVGIVLNTKGKSKKDRIVTPSETAEYALDRYSRLNSPENKMLISFGLPFLDKQGGMQGGDMGIISGPPGEGKTTFAKQIAGHVAKEHGPVLFVSLEMSQAQMADRNIARLTKEYIVKIMRGKYTEETYDKICGAIGELSNEAIYYYHPAVGNVPLVYANARKMQLQYGLALVVIDYIQLMRDVEGGRGENERLTNISAGIKGIARELDVPIVAVSRINRRKEGGNLERTYGSGALSYDPDWSFLLEREEDDRCKLTITKQRQGGMKDVEQYLKFDWKTQEFSEVAQ